MEHFLIPDTTQDLYVSYYGNERCEPGHQYGPSVRDHYLFVYVSKGTGIYRANGQETSLSQGQSFLLFPNVLTLYKADALVPWEYEWVGFSGAQIGEIMRNCGISAANPVFIHRTPDKIRNLLEDLLNYKQANDYTDHLFYSGILRILLGELGRDRTNREEERRFDNRFLQARNFMNQHFDKKITVSMIAKYMGMERTYFTKWYKAQSGRNPYEYILELRVSRGKQLLEQTDIPIEHLALMLGFHDTFHFSNYFKSRTGCSPLQYRKRGKK